MDSTGIVGNLQTNVPSGPVPVQVGVIPPAPTTVAAAPVSSTPPEPAVAQSVSPATQPDPVAQTVSVPVQPVVAPPNPIPPQIPPASSAPTVTPSPAKISPKKPVAKGIVIAIVVVLALLAVVGAAAYFFLIKPNSAPSDIRVTNLTDRSATISWVTEEAVPGVVIVKSSNDFKPFLLAEKDAKLYFDDRDVQAQELANAGKVVSEAKSGGDMALDSIDEVTIVNVGSYYVHHVTITDLDRETKYYFQVGNGTLYSASSEAFATSYTASSANSFTTLTEIEEMLTPSPTYGSVLSGESIVKDGVVYMDPREGSDIVPLSAVLNESGNWYIDLSNARLETGAPVDDFNESEDIETLLVEGGALGRVEGVKVPMSADAPADTINITDPEHMDAGNTVSQEINEGMLGARLTGEVHASPASCPESDPCTVSPIDLKNQAGTGDLPYQVIVSDADFPSLQEALAWAESSGSESWFTLLSGVGLGAREPKHVWIIGEISSQAAPTGPTADASGHVVPDSAMVPISASVHLIGEPVEEMKSMPEVVSMVKVKDEGYPAGFTPPWPGYTIPKRLFNLTPQLYFSGSASSSVEGVYFGRGAMSGNFELQTKAEAEDINNIFSTILAKNSKVDVRNCRFESHKNTDVVATSLPKSYDDIDYYRETAMLYDGSTGTIESNLVFGSWAGAVRAIGASSDVVIKNNQIGTGTWFSIWVDGGTAEIYGNVTYVIDGRSYNHCVLEPDDPDCAGWIGPLPLWDYPVYGIVANAMDSLVIEKNTIGTADVILKVNNSAAGSITKNLLIQGYVGDLEVQGSDGVTQTGNLTITWSQARTQMDATKCKGASSGDSGRSDPVLCSVYPKSSTNIATQKVGATFAQGWESWILYNKERGCESLSLSCAPSETMTCDTTQDACLRPGETVSAGGPTQCTIGANGVPSCAQQEPSGGTGGSGGGETTGGGATNVPVTPTTSPEEIEDDASLWKQFKQKLTALMGTVYAAPKTYTVSDDYVVIPTESGVFDIVIPGKGVAEDVVLIEGEEYTFFVDTNGSGTYDEGEELIAVEGLTVDLEVDDTQEVATMNLKRGLNFVSFEYLPEKVDSCELILEFDEQSDNGVTQIARFESGAFQVTEYRSDIGGAPSGDCFPVVPGRGYIVRAYGDEAVGYGGYRLLGPAGIAFDTPGWHLIGINGAGKVYSASELIDDIDAQDPLDADNVTQWLSNASKYNGLQKEEDEAGEMQTYGFDFKLESGKSYFVRIIEGTGVWTPS